MIEIGAENMEIIEKNSNTQANLLFKKYIENLRNKKRGNTIQIKNKLKSKAIIDGNKIVNKHRSYVNIQK